MKTITGAYASAVIYTDIIEDTAEEQIKLLCDQPFVKGSRIRIMPDVHAGKGCVIGFTADLGEMVIPYIVGVDIGCGMYTVELGNIDIDFEKLDAAIRKNVPSGKNVRKGAVSAREGEKLLIPINMRDGSLICIGKGNPEWNCKGKVHA